MNTPGTAPEDDLLALLDEIEAKADEEAKDIDGIVSGIQHATAQKTPDDKRRRFPLSASVRMPERPSTARTRTPKAASSHGASNTRPVVGDLSRSVQGRLRPHTPNSRSMHPSGSNRQRMLASSLQGSLARVHTTGEDHSSTANSVASSVFDSIKSRMNSLKVQVEDKDSTIRMLTKHIDKLKRSLSEKQVKLETEAEERSAEQKQKFDAAMKRQLDFSDRLLKDKEELTRKCDNLADTVDQLQTKFKEAMQRLEREHADDMKRARTKWAASEKVRREELIAKKTAAIKQMTIKGLEPEIQKLIDANKAEIKKLNQQHKESIHQKELEWHMVKQKELQLLRAQMIQEREDVVENERAKANDRIRLHIERYDQQMQEQRTSFTAELEKQRADLQEERRREVASLMEDLRAANRGESKKVKQLQEEHDEEMAELRRKYALTEEALKEKLKIEKSEYRNRLLDKVTRQLKTKEAELERALKAEQAEELKIIVDRLDEEFADKATRLNEEHNERMNSEKRLHSAALADLKSQLNETKTQSHELELQITALEHKRQYQAQQLRRIPELEKSLQRQRELVQELESQQRSREEQHTAQLRSQKSKVDELEGMLSQYSARDASQNQIIDARLAKQKEELECKHKAAVDSITKRVQELTRKRDLTIASLREQLASKEERCKHLETLLHGEKHM